MNRALCWTCALLALSVANSQARIYSRCELARDLRALGVHPNHISTWVCIAYHESRFDTAANNPHSGDHGIFQISELYWCGSGKVCGLPCAALRDDDIADDLECALQVHEEHTRLQGDGFLAWVVYPQHCKQSTKKYLIDCDENLKDTPAPSEVRALNAYSPYSYENRYRTRPADKTYTNNMNIDALLPPYLAITSIFRESYGKVLDHNKINGVDWYNYKYDKVDELKLPGLAPGQMPASTATTRTTTTYVPPVKPWRFIETNQFRKKASSSSKISQKITVTEDTATSENNALSYSTYKPPTESSTRESFTTVTAPARLSKVKGTIDSYNSPSVLTSTIKPVNMTGTAYKLPAYTSYNSQTNKYKPWNITYVSPTGGSANNYLTSTTGYESPSFTSTVRQTFPSFAFTFPRTTATPKTVSSTIFTFPPWAFTFRAQNISTTTVKPPTSTTKAPWYFTNRINPTSTTMFSPQNALSLTTSSNRQATRSLLTSSTQRPSVTKLYTTTTSATQKPTYLKISTTQKPAFVTSSTTQRPSLFTTLTTQKRSFFTTSVTQNPSFCTTTRKPTFTTLQTQRPTTRRTSRITQNIFDLYLNPTKAPQLPPYSFSRGNHKSKINIFSEGTTTITPFAKSEKKATI